MQQVWKQAYHKALLLNPSSFSKRLLPLVNKQTPNFLYLNQRSYAAELELKKQEEQAIDIDKRNQRIGVDMKFSEQKHAYVLTFPWNFQEIINDFESDYRPLPSNNYWARFINTNALFEFNSLFREFHQYCALPDYINMDKICEGRLSSYVKESLRRIHFHGLDIEMANLTVEQPRIKILKVEVHHGVDVDRTKNLPASEYKITKSKLWGAPQTVYVPKNDTRSIFDHLDSNYKPYVISATVLIESPMKLFVQNQNFSAILFGSNDQEIVKNVVRFEAPMRWLDLVKVLPVENKPNFDWKITDFNNVLNENPYLPQY